MAIRRQSIPEWLQQAMDDVDVFGKGDCHAFAFKQREKLAQSRGEALQLIAPGNPAAADDELQ